jgi:arabinose-5-phosphate isomerase
MGKSGIIGKKIAATLVSTGTIGYFMHPGEAFHGDLGMVGKDDIFIGISYSGETEELIKLIPFLKHNGNLFIGITGNDKSTLAKNSNYHINVKVPKEACPLQLAPTSSTTATLAMGDAIAVCLMLARNFKESDFARYHPGGSLGRRLISSVGDEMITSNLPIVAKNDKLPEVVSVITESKLGIAIVKLDNNQFGLITDGDIRRTFQIYKENIFTVTAGDMMSIEPVAIKKNTLISKAFEIMDQKGITSLLVINDEGEMLGIFKK